LTVLCSAREAVGSAIDLGCAAAWSKCAAGNANGGIRACLGCAIGGTGLAARATLGDRGGWDRAAGLFRAICWLVGSSCAVANAASPASARALGAPAHLARRATEPRRYAIRSTREGDGAGDASGGASRADGFSTREGDGAGVVSSGASRADGFSTHEGDGAGDASGDASRGGGSSPCHSHKPASRFSLLTDAYISR
jgi:hypothetical protein